MKIAICEDEISQQEKLEEMIYQFIEEDGFEICKFDSGEELMSRYTEGERFDILFLDIRMKKVDGIETAKKIREYDTKVFIILTTSLIEYAIKGYRVKANDFIEKPLKYTDFCTAFKRAIKEIKYMVERVYVVENREERVVIDVDHIYYIESFGRKVMVKTTDGIYEHYRNISDEEKKLKELGFVRTHRTYLVNMKNIYKIKASEILMKNKETIPISPRKRKIVWDEFTNFIIGE